MKVLDEDNTELGYYYTDLLVEDILIVEIKACRIWTDDHIAQILGYMRATGYEYGILVNFGSPKLQIKNFKNILFNTLVAVSISFLIHISDFFSIFPIFL